MKKKIYRYNTNMGGHHNETTKAHSHKLLISNQDLEKRIQMLTMHAKKIITEIKLLNDAIKENKKIMQKARSSPYTKEQRKFILKAAKIPGMRRRSAPPSMDAYAQPPPSSKRRMILDMARRRLAAQGKLRY